MRKKRIRIIACLLLISLLFSGCDIRNYFYSDASLKRVAQKLLKEKYGEEFVIHRVWDRSQELFFAECSPKEDPEVVFRADIRKNGSGILADGYAQGVIAKEVEQILEEDISILFPYGFSNARMPNYYNVPIFYEPQNIKIYEYLQQVNLEYMYIGYDIFLLDSDLLNSDIEEEYEFFSEKIPSEIKESIIPDMVFHIYYVDNNMLEKCREYYKTHAEYDSAFSEELREYDNFGFGYLDGMINITYADYANLRRIK